MNRSITIGALAVTVAAIILGASFSVGGSQALAGLSSPTSTATAVPPSATAAPGCGSGGSDNANARVEAAQVQPTCTSTAVPVAQTAVPTKTSTAIATATSAPATVAPNTAVPNSPVPTATPRSGGAGAAVGLPSTGTGDATSSRRMPWQLMIAGLFAVAGAGLLVDGLRKQRR